MKKYTPGIVLFIITLIIGIVSFKNYGVAWDEKDQRSIGYVNYNYAFHNDKGLLTYNDRDHGAGFELPLVVIEKLLMIKDTAVVYEMRHIVTHFFFLACVFCGYILIYNIFKNQSVACLGFILLAFMPRIYAHSFFNTKDIPFLSATLVSMLLAQVAFQRDKPNLYLLLGIACGYTTSIRVMGVLFAGCICLFFLIDIITALSERKKALPVIGNSFSFFIGFCVALYVFWPFLWSAPIENFLFAYRNLSHYSWNYSVFLNGVNYQSIALPWFYIPEWFCITIPLFWLLPGIAGFIWIIVLAMKKPISYIRNTTERNFTLYAVCFIAPVLAVIFLHSVVYDDWRHLYFIYPSFVMFVLFTANKLFATRMKWPAYTIYFLQSIYVCYFIYTSYPSEQVYFNCLVSHKKEYLRKNFDFEYWGVAYKQGLEYILAHDTSSAIKVVGHPIQPLTYNALALPKNLRKRIIISDTDDKHCYVITNFRNHPEDYQYPETLYRIKVLNSSIMCVYKIK